MEKSRERIRFEKFGILPDSLKGREAEVTPELHGAIMADLAARDDRLREEGREQVIPTLAHRTNPHGAVHPFMAAVKQLTEERGIDTASAMREIVAKNHSLYESYLTSANPSRSEPNRPTALTQPQSKIKHPFIQAVDKLKEEKNLPTDQAMGLAIKEHPDLYGSFMGKGQRRG